MTQESLDQKKGIPDIVFLLDASGSMKACIGAVTGNISTFIDTLGSADANGGVLIRDWRIRVTGYRDRDSDGQYWLVDNPFTGDATQAKAQLTALEAKGGGDEPESLLDALYGVSQWPVADKGAQAGPGEWRHRHDASRVVVIFTDASSKPTFKAADGAQGSIPDLIQACNAARLKILMFAPNAPCYADLAMMDGLEWEPVGDLGADPVKALQEFSGNQDNFRKVMEALAKTVATASAAPAL